MLWIQERHRQAAAQADKAGSSSKQLRDVSSDLTYHADPLNLSPLADLAQAYHFIGVARRMLPESGRSSISSEVRRMMQHSVQLVTSTCTQAFIVFSECPLLSTNKAEFC
jgi:hypothetical protein